MRNGASGGRVAGAHHNGSCHDPAIFKGGFDPAIFKGGLDEDVVPGGLAQFVICAGVVGYVIVTQMCLHVREVLAHGVTIRESAHPAHLLHIFLHYQASVDSDNLPCVHTWANWNAKSQG